MRYYKLTGSIEIDEIGYYPQDDGKIIDIASLGGIFGDSSLGAFGEIDKIEKLPELYLAPKAKATSYIKNTALSSWFLILKSDFIHFLKDFEISNYQFWQVNVHYKKQILTDYSLFHLSYPSQEKFVDFSNCNFFIGNIKDRQYKGDDIKIVDYIDYLNKRDAISKEGLLLKCNHLVFNIKDVKKDLIRLIQTPIIGGGYFVSEHLKEAIEARGFTGMNFKEISQLSPKIEVIY